MTGSVAFLERFDDSDKAVDTAPCREDEQRRAAYAEGYAAGEAAALTRAAEQNERLQHAAIAMERKLTEFDDEVAGVLCDALASAAASIFPALAERGFAHEAALCLSEIVTNEDKANLVIRTAREKDEPLRAAMSSFDIARRTNIIEDDALSDLAINVEWNGGGVNFDVEKAISTFIASLEKASEELKGQGTK